MSTKWNIHPCFIRMNSAHSARLSEQRGLSAWRGGPGRAGANGAEAGTRRSPIGRQGHRREDKLSTVHWRGGERHVDMLHLVGRALPDLRLPPALPPGPASSRRPYSRSANPLLYRGFEVELLQPLGLARQCERPDLSVDSSLKAYTPRPLSAVRLR
ncbi:hypothetical protein SKAU_G00402960 [Synaphobranchus kaupii]|uniref:Uncharacterized protein n=1 Tax=Synaphobranchus kaupii TaxID=118154 RepID=A0A9Q1E9H4_SYNKA|nr:hypothetical protein SKAU_G00402960 [Synaphobranchus kaupii]